MLKGSFLPVGADLAKMMTRFSTGAVFRSTKTPTSGYSWGCGRSRGPGSTARRLPAHDRTSSFRRCPAPSPRSAFFVADVFARRVMGSYARRRTSRRPDWPSQPVETSASAGP